MIRERFEETQRLPAWLWGIVVALFALGAWMFVQQIVFGRPFGDNPASDRAVWILAPLVGLLFPAFLASLHLTTNVDDQELVVRFFPFPRRTIPRKDIREIESVAYRPIRDCGGWGLRYSFKFGWCYTMSGTAGVRLVLKNGKKLLIGSKQAEELASALGDSERRAR